jgi:uncharacterized protein
MTRRWLVTAVLAVVTILATVAVSSRLKLDPNVASLLPERGESAALRQYLRAFGGSDLGMILVSAPGASDAEVAEVREVADTLARELSELPTVKIAAAGVDTGSGALDPMLAWRHADAAARERLAAALTPEGMRERLEGSRKMLLAPGASEASARIAADPLRLGQLLQSDGVATGFSAQPDGSFATEDGRARLVLVFPEGQALRGDDARAFVNEARTVLDRVAAAHPELSIGMTGGHAIAEATERMLFRDLGLSGALSMVLASLAFILTFRRVRALIAVMPPLFLGSVWTAGIAASMPSGLSAIAVAFMSVVIGVGVDTGVHVYAALLEARRDGLSPADAARQARKKTQKPVLVAALTAGAAFGALGLSEIAALRQLGILCAGGEMLTAIAIVVVTPEIGAWLERKPPPPEKIQRWTIWASKLTKKPAAAMASLAIMLAPAVALGFGYGPEIADAVIAMRPKGLEPLEVQQRIYDTFGGRPGQWVILVSDQDRDRARQRADAVAEALGAIGEHLESVDALTAIAPAPVTQQNRFKSRDALDLPAKADALEAALSDTGFAPARFEEVLEGMRAPPRELVALEDLEKRGDAAILVQRYLGRDGGDHVVVVYALPRIEEGLTAEHEAAVEAAVRAADPSAAITGYGRLERSLKQSLLTDLPRIGIVALTLVLAALWIALRRVRDVLLAIGVVAAEIGIVLFLVRLLDVPLHAYDALVLPVLLGITVDEGMFLLFRAREEEGEQVVEQTLRHEGPPVATTALTTAAGFAGLIACDFDGLRHLGMVGAIGSLAGLLVALVVVPAGLRLARWRLHG